MASVHGKGISVKFSSLPNFRNLAAAYDPGTEDATGDGQRKFESPVVTHNLYRSSRPDLMTESDVDEFLKLGIRSIIDLRSISEYRRASGLKLLDNVYPVYKVLATSVGDRGDTSVKCTLLKKGSHTNRKHFLINFFGLDYVLAMLRRASWSIVLCALFWLIVDLIKRTGFKHCIRTFAKGVMNEDGVYGLYVDLITYSQPSICAALRLLSDRKNLPAMLNCAHGKDRTGIVMALVLSCIGLDKETIANDYAASEHGLNAIRDRVNQEFAYYHMSSSFTSARSETMMKILQYIDDKYGGAGAYMESIGFSAKEQLQLRHILLS